MPSAASRVACPAALRHTTPSACHLVSSPFHLHHIFVLLFVHHLFRSIRLASHTLCSWLELFINVLVK